MNTTITKDDFPDYFVEKSPSGIRTEHKVEEVRAEEIDGEEIVTLHTRMADGRTGKWNAEKILKYLEKDGATTQGYEYTSPASGEVLG